MRYWNRLPRKIVDALTMGAFKVRLDKVTLSNLVQRKVSLPIAGGLES